MGALACCCIRLNSETLMVISVLYIVMQTLLWFCCIYSTLFTTVYIYSNQIPYISDENPITEFSLSLVIIFLTICLFRNFYMGYKIKSNITKKESDMNKIIFLEEHERNEKNASTQIEAEDKSLLKKEKSIILCGKCKLYRGVRAHHCSICNICSDKMDHHCHVIKNCVGGKNYKFFFSYLFCVTNTSFMILVFSLLRCYKYYSDIKVRINY